jgi:hypothetical protein
MLIHAYNHARLMEESESRVEMTAYLHTPADAAASRVLESPDIYRRWEAEHDRLMRTVSEVRRIDAQVAALRATVFRLVHRRALFEYLRVRHVTGPKRHWLLGIFYGCRDYTNAVIAEHSNYVRCSTSYVCTHHLGEHLMNDAAFDEPMQLYEQWYSEYFRVYCDFELAETVEEKRAAASLDALKPLLKYRLNEARQAILAMPPMLEKDWREVQIRKPNGDTQRLRALFGSN